MSGPRLQDAPEVLREIADDISGHWPVSARILQFIADDIAEMQTETPGCTGTCPCGVELGDDDLIPYDAEAGQ